MVAEPSQVSVSRADVFHCFPKAMVWLAQAFPLAAHTSCQMPWSWSATSTVHANVSPVSGFKASVPRYIGQAVEPVEPGRVGHMAVVNPALGCAASRVQWAPSMDR